MKFKLYTWAYSPLVGMRLRPDTGMEVGQKTRWKYLVLQVHYKKALEPGTTDNSSVTFHMDTSEMKFKAGVFNTGKAEGSMYIPPGISHYKHNM